MKKLSKFGRSTLSLLLCLTMLLTTFCFFDIGSVISEAIISKGDHALTEAGTTSNTFAEYSINLPELVYIKPGGKDSQYFLNASSSGAVNEPTSETSTLSFSCSTARSVTFSVALYDSTLSSTVSSNHITNIAFADGTYMSSDKDKSLSVSASSVNKTIKSITMEKAESGKEYILRWTIVYTTASGSYTTYAYTGIKFPLLSQAGMTTRQYYYGTSGGLAGNPAESAAYSFITGVDAVKGGNIGSKWVSTGSSLTAPLINFNSSLYPNSLDTPIDSNYFDPNGSGVLLGFAKRDSDGVYFAQGSRIYNTQWDSSSNYNPMSMIHHANYFGGKPSTDGDAYGYAAADITIDISRYTNFNQVPNLNAGFVEFDSDGGEDDNYLNAIRNCSYTTSDAADYFRNNRTTDISPGKQNTSATIYCENIDRSDVKNDRVFVRGLYKLTGNINEAKTNLTKSTSGSEPQTLRIATYSNNVYSTYIRFEHSLRFNPWIGYKEYCSNVSAVKLNATLANKSTARTYYYKYLNSGVNTSASNWSTINSYVQSYVKTLCVSSAAAGSYTDPTSAISAAQTNLKTVMKSTFASSAPVYFDVPETIYLTPQSGTGTSDFQYVLDQTLTLSDGEATKTVNTGYKSISSGGNISFYYADAKNVRLTVSGATAGLTTSGNGVNIKALNTEYSCTKDTLMLAKVTSGSKAYTSGFITWTATYYDNADGHTKSISAKTYVYAPFTGVAAALGAGSYKNKMHSENKFTSTYWITGGHSVKSRTGTLADGANGKLTDLKTGAMYDPPLYDNTITTGGNGGSGNNSEYPTTIPTGDGTTYARVKDDQNNKNMYVYGGTLTINVDKTRFSKFDTIPNFKIGYDVNHLANTDRNNDRWMHYDVNNSLTKTFDTTTTGRKINTAVNGTVPDTDTSYEMTAYANPYYHKNDSSKIPITNHIYLSVLVNKKDALRTAIVKAQKQFANFGIYNGDTMSSYYYEDELYNTFVSKYKAAYEALTKVDQTYTANQVETIANALTTALNNLLVNDKTKNNLKINCTAREYNLGLEKLSNGQYKIVEIKGGKQYSMTYDARDNVYFTPDTYEGYTFAGKYSLTSTITPSNLYGRSIPSLPAFMSASDYSKKVINTPTAGVATISATSSTNKTTTVPKFDGNNTTYEWVAAVNDPSLTIVNFYFVDQNVVTFDVNYDSNKPNLMGAYTRASNGGFSAITSSTTNGVTTTYNRTTGEFTVNGKMSTVQQLDLMSALLPEDFSAGTYTLKYTYLGGEIVGAGGNFSLTNPGASNSYIAMCADLTNENGTNLSSRCYIESYGAPTSFARNIEVSAVQASAAYGIRYSVIPCATAGAITSLEFKNLRFKIEYVKSTDTGSGFVPNSLIQFYGRQLGTLPTPVRDNYEFLGWFTAPDGGERVTASDIMGTEDMTVYAHWEPDSKVVLLDNDFDFDDFVGKGSTAATTLNSLACENGSASFDPDTREITLKPTGADCYTSTYDSTAQYRSTLEAGKKYTLMMDYNASTNVRIRPFVFFYPSATSTSYTSTAAIVVDVPAGTGTYAMQFTVPTDNYYQIRFGIYNYQGGSTLPGSVTFGNISIQRTEIYADGAYNTDSSTYLGWVSKVTGSSSTGSAVYVNDLNSRYEKITSHYQDIGYQNAYTNLRVPTREGYNFVGWFDASGTQYTDASGVGTKVCTTDGVKLYSRWTAKDFSLKYNAYKPNDSKGVATSGTVGSLPSPNPQSLKFGIASTISSTLPTLTGYTFAGWSTTSGGSAAYQKGAALSASTVSQMYQSCSGETYNLYTAWTANKFKVKFNGNGGITETNETEYEQQFTYDVYQKLTQNAFVNSRTVTYNKNDTTAHPATLSTTSVTKELSFKGWTASAEAVATANPTVKYTNQQEIKNPNGYATSGGTTNLYAKWQGVTVTLPTPTRTGYKFDGWYDAATGGTKVGDAGASYIITADKTLYAHWTVNSYKVTYNFKTNGGTPDDIITSVNYGAPVDLPKKVDSKSGWEFVGWNTNKDATTALTSLTMPANNVTLYAIYKKTLTANFYSGTNKATNDPRTVTIWNRATSGTVTSPTTYTSVWTFVGWTSATTATASTSYIGTGVTVTITASEGEVNYYALYKQLHTLAYDANGGSGAPAKSEAYGYYNSCPAQQNGQHTISSTVPTKTGYTFGGWNTNTSGTGTNYTAGQTYTNTASSNTLYAKWTVKSYKVTYDYKTNGGSSATKTTASVNYGAAVDLTPTATKAGWTFVGWNTNKDATTAITSLTMPDNDITLYAIYKKTITAKFYWINASDGKTVTESSPNTVTIFNKTTSGTVTCSTTPANVNYNDREFTWIGWRTDTTAAAQTKTKSTSQSVSADTNFYAVYSGTLTLSYNANKGTGAPSGQNATQYLNSTGTTGSVSYNKSEHEFTISTTVPTYTGWNFDGWSRNRTATSGEYGASPKDTKISKVSVNTTLYAIWNKTFTVNFHYYNNQVEPKTLTIYNGASSATVASPPIADPTVDGITYTGRGWSTSNSATASVSVASGANVSVSGNANYYASYEVTRKATFYYCTEPTSTNNGSEAAQASVNAFAVRYMNYTGSVTDSNYTVPTAVTSSHGSGVAENYIGVSTAKNNSSTVTPTTANITFYAVYSESLTFYYYNGSAHTSSSLSRYMLSNGKSYNASMSGTVPTPSNIDSKTVWSGNWSYVNNSYGTGYFSTPTATGVNSLYAVYNKPVALIYNLNGATSSAIANTTGTAHLISKNGGVNTFAVSLAITDTVPTKTNYTFLGWADTASATAPQYYAKHSFSLSAEKTIYAVWLETATPDGKVGNKDTYSKEIDVVKGVKVTGFTSSDVNVQEITTKHKLYNASENAAYQALCDAYTSALNTYKNSPSVDNAKALTTARNNLANAVAPKYNSSDRTYLDGKFTIEYASGVTNRPVTAGEHSVSELNLNHYTTANLDSTLSQLNASAKITLASEQETINTAVKTIAKNFVNKALAKDTDPMYSVYENANKAVEAKLATSGIKAINYVYTGKGNYTYYCYTNTATPTLLLTVDDVVGNGRVCYPTKSKVEKTATVSGTVNSSAYSIGTTSVANNEYQAYLYKGMGTSMTGGAEYYSKKSVVTLTPTFTSGKDGAVCYQIKASDDSYNSASTEFGGNYATTSKLSSGKTSNAISTSTPDTNVTPENTITIVIDYHETTNEAGYSNSMYIYGDQVINDKWLKQFHILRSSGGASNWEWPKTTDAIYTVNDGTYGQSNYGSFTYTFTYTSGASNNFAAASLGTIDAATIAGLLKSTANYNSMKAKKFAGANAGGDGLGYMEWPASGGWNINYYPKNQAYTYVHIVDRWGNVDDKVIYVGNIDAIAAQFKTASVGDYTVLEDGGSGIDTLSLNSSGFEILTDDNSTLENNVFRTAGNTVRISTGEANKAYNLTMTDKATNSSTATVTSDENGIITLSVEDTAYESGVYTFMLNSVEVNLYDGVDKYVLSVSGDEVDEGETAQITVTTKGDVSKLRFTDESGNTSTVSSFVQNDDGTRTWTFAKARPAGEYTYKITVKVGYEWLDEGDTATLIFNERILDSGKVRSAEYDEETGLYKVTFEGRATKVQFVSEDGMTRTYTRYAEAVKSKKTYDADGNEVNDTARTLDHEAWYVEAKLYSGQNYTVVGKFESGWNRAKDATSTVTGK